MISVLIPIYNFDVRLLVAELVEEFTELNTDYEILAIDDGSYFDFRIANQRIAAYHKVVYRELSQNIGRAKIRNLLAQEAKFDKLIFMDCDTQCGSTQFIANYLKSMRKDVVLCGGLRYPEEEPKDTQLRLHWHYGLKREALSLAKRQKKPYKQFLSSNFAIHKDLFLSIRFDETIDGYGHEDTLFGLELKQNSVPILHIENPVIHLGLKSTHHFLEGNRQAVRNLARLIRQGRVDKGVSLFKWYRRILRMGILKMTYRKLDKNRNVYLNQLHEGKPELKNLDKLKLLWLIEELHPQHDPKATNIL